jgi:hypothetical protein
MKTTKRLTPPPPARTPWPRRRPRIPARMKNQTKGVLNTNYDFFVVRPFGVNVSITIFGAFEHFCVEIFSDSLENQC